MAPSAPSDPWSTTVDLKLSVHGPLEHEDVLVAHDARARVGDVAAALRRGRTAPAVHGRPPGTDGTVTLAVAVGGTWHPLPVDLPMARSGILAGSTVRLQTAPSGPDGCDVPEPVARLSVLHGPDAGAEFLLPPGRTLVGRAAGCTVRLSDPLVSKQHVAVEVAQTLEVLDLNSSNGVEVDGVRTARAVVGPQNVLTLGDSEVRVTRCAPSTAGRSATVAFVRSPVVEPVHRGLVVDLPEPPARERSGGFPWLSLVVPLLLGVGLWLFGQPLLSVVFIALSPLFMLAAVVETRLSAGRAFRRAAQDFRRRVAQVRTDGLAALDAERAARLREHPPAADTLRAALDRSPLLWSRAAGRPRFLEVRVGLARRPSRNSYVVRVGQGDPDLGEHAREAVRDLADVDGVPVVARLDERGALGVCGPGRHDVVRGLLLQVLGLHAPRDVRVVALAPASAVPQWGWLRWLPHTVDGGPLGRTVLGADSTSCEAVLARVEALVDERLARPDGAAGAAVPTVPVVLVVVDEGAPVERGRLLAVAERGRRVGVRLLWTAPEQALLPAACRQFLDLSGHRFADADSGEVVGPVVTEPVTAAVAEAFARRLSPVVEADAFEDGEQDLPRAAAYLDQPGVRDLLAAPALVERWTQSGSLVGGGPRRRPGTLRALVGLAPGAPFHLDLHEQGPHALVGGTTGSGKSGFLQSWILGMALSYSPQRVTFLLVDYKGGTAFKDCADLPHTVGLVTDLDGHLVTRALTSLKAELRHRESLLNDTGFADLAEMEKADHPLTPPSLVIVVDEFAALVQEVPEFVDGVIDVAQRGRSLGLHLILATQRPAGVIRENLRANTNLRVALRVADDEDSVDVIGSTQAARFPPGTPGRAVAKTGPNRTQVFQALHAAGTTPDTPPPPQVRVAPLRFGAVTFRDAAEPVGGPADVPSQRLAGRVSAEVPVQPSDLARLVGSARAADRRLGLLPPRRPWLPPLQFPAGLSLALPGPDDEPAPADGSAAGVPESLVLGLSDLPEQQAQGLARYVPDVDGTMVVLGAGATGKSTALRSLATAASVAAASPGSRWQVYAIDCGGGGLAPLSVLPTVGSVVGHEDVERVTRLLGDLRRTIDVRSREYAAVRAGGIADFRVLGDRPQEPRVLLLVDSFGAFRAQYETAPHSRLLDLVQSIAQDGRQVGVHVVVSADRPGAVPSALAATAQKQLVLRLAQDVDLAGAGLRADAFGRDPVPGRGYLDGTEVQVGVPGGSARPADQAARLQALGDELTGRGVPPAPAVGRLPQRVGLDTLPVLVDAMPALGVADDTLAPLGFHADGPFLLAGPPQSGRSTVLTALARSLQRAEPDLPLVHVGRRRSLALSAVRWTATAAGDDDVGELARQWAARASAGERFAVFVEGIPDYLGTTAELDLTELVTACAATGNPFVAEGDSSQVGSSWPLLQAVRTARHGLVLQPDTSDGEVLLRTSFPRVTRGAFPCGRGLYVRSGRCRTVQVALPE